MKVIVALFFSVLFGYVMYKGFEMDTKQYNKCKSMGGVPMTERSMYKACMKPEQFIEVPE